MRLTYTLSATLIALGSCVSPSYSSEASKHLVDQLIRELEERVSLSEQRIYVPPFMPGDREGEQKMRIMDDDMWTRHRNTARLLRHEILGFLAPHMYVLDVPDDKETSGRDPEKQVYKMAAEEDATLILFGRYSMESSDIRVMLRAVDVSTKTILVAVDGLMGHVEIHEH